MEARFISSVGGERYKKNTQSAFDTLWDNITTYANNHENYNIRRLEDIEDTVSRMKSRIYLADEDVRIRFVDLKRI